MTFSDAIISLVDDGFAVEFKNTGALDLQISLRKDNCRHELVIPYEVSHEMPDFSFAYALIKARKAFETYQKEN